MNMLHTLPEWQKKLGLSDWTIELRHVALEGEEANIVKGDTQKWARITIDLACPTSLYEYTLVHELLHLVLRNTEWYMMHDRDTDTMEGAHKRLEIDINVLAKALTGAEWYPWHRDDEIKKRV